MLSNKTNIRKLRYAVQLAFTLLTVVTGYRFYCFVMHFESAGLSFVQRICFL